jgi:hypothetical protein
LREAGRWTRPEGILDGPEGRIGNVQGRVINPHAQIEIKRMMPIWVPGRPRRPKDLSDIVKIEQELIRRKDGPSSGGQAAQKRPNDEMFPSTGS